MTSEAFKEMMRAASLSVRLANAGNQNLTKVHQPMSYLRPHSEETEPGKFPPIPSAAQFTDDLRASMVKGIQPSTDESKLNKNEKHYLAWLRRQGNLWIGIQCLTLKLGDDCRFTPDFWAADQDGIRAIDVKARWSNGKVHVEDDARVKLQVAARMFPVFHFVIAWREGEIWHHKAIKS